MTAAARRLREVAHRSPRMFWLDGGGAAHAGRGWVDSRSVLGWLEDGDVSLTFDASAREVRRVTRGGDEGEVVGDDVFTALATELARDRGDPSVGWVGWFGYACRTDLPALVAPSGPGRVPDAVWMRSRRACREVLATGAGAVGPAPSSYPPEPTGASPGASVDREEYDRWFTRVQDHLHRGNSYEVNLTYREGLVSPVPPTEAYLRLRAPEPAPYAGFLRHGDVRVLSSSPERYATLDGDRWLETRPIKGTTPRGVTAAEDEAHRGSLASDPRYRAENLMVTDLLRNDLSMVCEPGTVTVPQLMAVESYPAVHQLVSTVRGRLRPGVGTVEALRALFPAGSMTGAPKRRTMEVVAEVETTPRGVYAGALGWIGGDGRADLGVVIRTLVARPAPGGRGGFCYEWGTGGGITVRSDAASEYAETRWKAARLRAALLPGQDSG